MAQQQQVNHKFVLGNKELEGKIAEFLYDHGWYSITDIVGEDRNEIYKSRNAQEAYMKWNVYIGRKKERPQREDRRRDFESDSSGNRQNQSEGKRNFQNDRRKERYNSQSGEERRNRSEDYQSRNNEEKSGEENRSRYNEKRYEQREQSSGQAIRKDDRGTKKKTYQNKHRRDRKPRGEYKRQNNKITNYEMEEE